MKNLWMLIVMSFGFLWINTPTYADFSDDTKNRRRGRTHSYTSSPVPEKIAVQETAETVLDDQIEASTKKNSLLQDEGTTGGKKGKSKRKSLEQKNERKSQHRTHKKGEDFDLLALKQQRPERTRSINTKVHLIIDTPPIDHSLQASDINQKATHALHIDSSAEDSRAVSTNTVG